MLEAGWLKLGEITTGRLQRIGGIFTGLEDWVQLVEERKEDEREGAQKEEKNMSLKGLDVESKK